MDKHERISFTQVCKVLGKYPIIIACPESLKLNAYYEINSKILVKNFNPDYFKSVEGYNQLLLSSNFYSQFNKYKYILLYQLDAFVFSDELEFWCEAGYDYIGAPWFEGFGEATEKSIIIGIGNGGFSLRNIKNSLKILKQLKTIEILNQYSKFSTKTTILKFIRIYYEWIKNKNQLAECIKQFNEYEDLFWSVKIQEQIVNFKRNKNILSKIYRKFFLHEFSLGPVNEAIEFSFENLPKKLFNLNNNKLPFGCHAWFKYDYQFWKPFIDEFGYNLP